MPGVRLLADVFSKAKRIQDAYPFTTAKGVKAFLFNRDKLRESTYLHGGVDTLVLLIDFAALEDITELTEKQREILDLYYIHGFKLVEIGAYYGLKPHTISEHIDNAAERLAARYVELTGGDDELCA